MGFNIILRKQNNKEKIEDLINFRNNCKKKGINFYIANNTNLLTKLRADGLYISAYNKSFRFLSLKKSNFKLIGSAHNLKEIALKSKQGCDIILFSKLFLVSYDKKAAFLGVIRFNNYLKINKNLIPLGGISITNLNNLNNVNCQGFALLSEVKKKPAKIFSRLF